jgi:hypothetical protein
MKNRLLFLAAFALVLPAMADEPRQTVEDPHALPVSVSNPERMLMEIDFKVLLRHYEKLKTEIGETEVQLALAEAGELDATMMDAAKELALVENDKTASKEDLDRAQRRYKESLAREHDRLRSRLQVLETIVRNVRKEAEFLAQELTKRTAAESKTAVAQPQS